MRLSKVLAVSSLVATFVPHAAFGEASAVRTATISAVAGSPVKLCKAQVRIYDGLHGEPKAFLDLCLAYDLPAAALHAVRYRIDAMDAFGASIGSTNVDDDAVPTTTTQADMLGEGTGGLGVYVDADFTKCWGIKNPFAVNADSFKVSVSAVAYTSGKKWTAASAKGK